MCKSILEGGHRCAKHAAEKETSITEYEKMTAEEQLKVDEPIRYAYEARITEKRAKAAANSEKAAARLAAKDITTAEEIAAAERGANRADVLLTPLQQRVAVHLRKNATPTGGAVAVAQAVNAAPYISDDTQEDVSRKSAIEKSKAEEAVAAERATIINPRQRAGRHTATPDDNTADVKFAPYFTAEEAEDNHIRAAVFGLSMNAYAARQVLNWVKGKRKDMRAVNLTSGADAIKGRELWASTSEAERREIATSYHKAETAEQRQKSLGVVLVKADARIAALKLRQQTLNDSQRAPHPDGGYGEERQSLKSLQREKHAVAAELATLREGLPAVRAEHKALVAKEQERIATKLQARKQAFALIEGVIRIGSELERKRWAGAFMAGISLGAAHHAGKPKPVKKIVSA